MITYDNNNILHTARISVHKTEDPPSQRYISALPVTLDCHHAPSASLSYWLADRNNSVTIMWENATLRLVMEENILNTLKNIGRKQKKIRLPQTKKYLYNIKIHSF